jgi:hypothetical protein
MGVLGPGQGDGLRAVWHESIHDEAGRWSGAILAVREDRAVVLGVGDRFSVLDRDDARSLFAALGDLLQDGS